MNNFSVHGPCPFFCLQIFYKLLYSNYPKIKNNIFASYGK